MNQRDLLWLGLAVMDALDPRDEVIFYENASKFRAVCHKCGAMSFSCELSKNGELILIGEGFLFKDISPEMVVAHAVSIPRRIKDYFLDDQGSFESDTQKKLAEILDRLNDLKGAE